MGTQGAGGELVESSVREGAHLARELTTEQWRQRYGRMEQLVDRGEPEVERDRQLGARLRHHLPDAHGNQLVSEASSDGREARCMLIGTDSG